MEKCSVCLEPTNNKLDCKHHTCVECINKWKRYNSCPVCRARIDKSKPIIKFDNYHQIITSADRISQYNFSLSIPCTGCGTGIMFDFSVRCDDCVYCNGCGTCLYCSERCRNDYENN